MAPKKTSKPSPKKVTKKALHRSQSDRIIAGVCGGIGEYLGWNSWVVRVLFVLFFHPLLLVYLILWVFVPEE